MNTKEGCGPRLHRRNRLGALSRDDGESLGVEVCAVDPWPDPWPDPRRSDSMSPGSESRLRRQSRLWRMGMGRCWIAMGRMYMENKAAWARVQVRGEGRDITVKVGAITLDPGVVATGLLRMRGKRKGACVASGLVVERAHVAERMR